MDFQRAPSDFPRPCGRRPLTAAFHTVLMPTSLTLCLGFVSSLHGRDRLYSTCRLPATSLRRMEVNVTLEWFCTEFLWRIRRFRSRRRLQAISILLWMIRRFRFALECESGCAAYAWVSSPDGGFDHWFVTDGKPYTVGTTCRRIGFSQFAWSILSPSKLLIGRERRGHSEAVLGRSETYYCSKPIFNLRLFSR